MSATESAFTGLMDVGDTIQLVELAMRTHKDSYEIQREGGRVLHSLISQGKEIRFAHAYYQGLDQGP